MERFGAGESPDELLWGPPPPSPEQRRRQLLILAGIVAAVILVVGVTIIADQSREPAGGSAPSPTPSARSTPALPTSRSAPSPSNPRPVVRKFGTSLRDLDVDLFARDENSVFRIETRAGRITETSGSQFDTTDPLSFIAGPRQVLLRPMDDSTGYVVPDRRPARLLTGRLSSPGRAIPGPPGRLWISTNEWNSPMTLVDFEGRPTGTTVRPGSGGLVSDGAGGLLRSDVGGTYAITSTGARRLTRGTLLAVGRRHLLFADCDARLVCSSYLYDRSTKNQRRIARVRTDELPNGIVSPDGRYAALVTYSPRGEGQLFTVIDLASGRRLLRHGETASAEYGFVENSHLWSPDNRLVGLRSGRLFVLDPRTGKVSEPDLGLPSLLQITGRATN